MAGSVVIYGDSLLLSGVETGLRACLPGRVVHLSTGQLAALDLAATRPAAVIYDMAAVDAQTEILAACPGILVVGLDALCDQVTIVKGRQERVTAVGDLAACILRLVDTPDPLGFTGGDAAGDEPNLGSV